MSNLLSKKEAARLVGLHPESIMRMVREGRFVQPIRTAPTKRHSVRFLATEVEAWIEERIAARDGEAV